MTNYEQEPWDAKIPIPHKVYTGTYINVREQMLREEREPVSIREIMFQRLQAIAINETELIKQRWYRRISSLEGVIVRPDGKHKLITFEQAPWYRLRDALTDQTPIQTYDPSDRVKHPQGLVVTIGSYLNIRTTEFTKADNRKHALSEPTAEPATDNPYWQQFVYGSSVYRGANESILLITMLKQAGYLKRDYLLGIRNDFRLQVVYMDVLSQLARERNSLFIPRIYIPEPTNQTVFYPACIGSLEHDSPITFDDHDQKKYLGKLGYM